MAPPPIIADSDDSDSEPDLRNSPANPPTANEERSSDPASTATGSTDPKLFQAIYHEQRGTAADEVSLHRDVPPNSNDGISSSGSARKQQTKKDHDTNTSSLTSITDPARGLDRARKARKTDVVDLTQVTTQRKTAAMPKDMWDVPSSPPGDQSTSVATVVKNKTPISTIKRKRGNNVEFTSPLAVQMPSQGSTQPFDTTPAGRGRGNSRPVQATKRQKLEGPVSPLAEDDVDMIVLTHSAGSLPADGPVSGQKQVSLYIEPRTLTLSQRMQYEDYSVDPSPEDLRPAPTRHFTTTQQAAARSSGATTIAYSTPSQRRVLGALQESFPGEDDSGLSFQHIREAKEGATQIEGLAEPQSSPDIISLVPSRGDRTRTREKSPGSPEAHDPAGWQSDDVGFQREMYKPRPSRTRNRDVIRQNDSGIASPSEVPLADMGSVADLPAAECLLVSTPKTKKRGRPRKSDTAAAASTRDTAENKATDSPVAADPATMATQITKKKRGRPKKVDKAVATGEQQQSGEHHEGAKTAHEAKKATASVDLKDASEGESDEYVKPTRAKRCGQDVAEKQPTADKGLCETEEDQALQQVMTPKTMARPGSDGPDPQSAATERKVAATPSRKDDEKKQVADRSDEKQGVTSATPLSSQAGKPLYRVGLSKRSRIAPLLKSLRK